MTLLGDDPTGLTEIQKIYEQSQVPLRWFGQIPNRVFQTSIGEVIDPTDSTRLRSQRLRYAQHNFYLFDEAGVEAYMLQYWSHRRIFEVFHSARFSTVKADIWRYCVLYHYGGIYVDMNSELGFDPDSIDLQARELVSFEDRALEETLKNCDSPHTAVFSTRAYAHPGLMLPRNVCLQQALVFAPSHPLLYRVIEIIEQTHSFFRDRVCDDLVLTATCFSGAATYTRAVWEYLDGGGRLLQCDVHFSRTCRFDIAMGKSDASMAAPDAEVLGEVEVQSLAHATVPHWFENASHDSLRFGDRVAHLDARPGQGIDASGNRVLFFRLGPMMAANGVAGIDALCLEIARYEPRQVTLFGHASETPTSDLLDAVIRMGHLLHVFGFEAAYASHQIPISLDEISDTAASVLLIQRFNRSKSRKDASQGARRIVREDIGYMPRLTGTLPAHEIRKLVGTDSPLIVEVGAHDGSTTAEFLQAMPNARIVCFEPDPRAIRRHRARLGTDPRVTLIPCAIGREAGSVRFWQSGGFEHLHPDGWDHSGSIKRPKEHLNVWPGIRFDKQIEVVLTTLDNWHRAAGHPVIDFVWADVQGAEEDLILGSQEALGSTRFFYTEYSNSELYEDEIGLQRIYDLMPDFEVLRLFEGDVLLSRLHESPSGSGRLTEYAG